MISFSVYYQITEFVENSAIGIKEQFGDYGEFLGYHIWSLIDPELSHIAIPHSVPAFGVAHLKKNFREKLVKNFVEGKPLPFKIIQ